MRVGLDEELSLVDVHYDTIYNVKNEKLTKMVYAKISQSYNGAILNKEDLVKIRDWANRNIKQWDEI